MDITPKDEQRYWSNVAKGEGCWLWTGGKDKCGYGRINVKREMIGAHRVAYFLGSREDPGVMHVCHRCDNPSCVNPDHLWLGTHADNMKDKIAKGRATGPKGVRQHSARLTPSDVVAIRERHRQGETYTSIAADYGVSLQNVSAICRRVLWKDVA